MMRYVFLVWCLAARWVSLDAQVLDDFADGDLSMDPPWYGDTADFEVVSERLWLNALPQTDTSWISTLIPPPDSAEWKASLRLDFNPSGSNYLRWYLLATEPDLTAAQEGYFVQVGGSSSDRVSFCHFASGSESVLWESNVDAVDLDTVSLRLRVEYFEGNWKLERFVNNGWSLWGSASDTLNRPFQNTGIWCRYTSTRSDRFSFDDFIFDYHLWEDTLDPFVESYQLSGSNSLTIEFSEVVNADNIRLRALPSSSWFDAHPDRETGELFIFNLDQPILDGIAYRVELMEWSDLSGRTLDTNWIIVYHRPRLRDILITEIMPDPSPPVELPNQEYIEIFNRTTREIELERLELWVNDKVVNLAAGQIKPGSFLVLKDIPRLPNSGAKVMLKERSGRLIDAVDYSIDDHTISAKEEGGWSLVLADTARSCYGDRVWVSSEDPRGGSPAEWDVSAELPQPRNRWLQYGWYGDTVELRWLHPLDSVYWHFNMPRVVGGALELAAGIEHPFDVEYWRFSGVVPNKGVEVYWPNGVRDCRGRHSFPDTLRVFPVTTPDSGDIRVSEILFEPSEDRPEWIEVLNVSGHAIDMSDLQLGTYDLKFGVVDDIRKPFQRPTVLSPGERIVCTRDPEQLWENYTDLDSFMVWPTQEWLALSNDSLVVGVFTSGFELIEVFQYSITDHLPYLWTTKDVSLERVNMDSSGLEGSSWHSGPTALEGATPTRPNAQFNGASLTQGFTYPEIITPNGDGLNDLTTLSWSFPKRGWRARVFVVDMNGRLVYEHPAAGSTPEKMNWTWSGQRYSGTLCLPGIYLWVLELTSPSGREELHRVPVVLSF